MALHFGGIHIYVCMAITYSKSMGQSSKVANPARDQLNKEMSISVPVRASKLSLARRVRSSRPTSACSFSTLRLNLVLTEFLPISAAASINLYRHTSSGQSRVLVVTIGTMMVEPSPVRRRCCCCGHACHASPSRRCVLPDLEGSFTRTPPLSKNTLLIH